MKKSFLYFLSISLITVGCSDNSSKTDDTQEKTITVQEEDVVNAPFIENTIVYAIPSPNEQLEILKYTGGVINENSVHDLSKSGEYTNSMQKALNFGIYSTDAGYLACFGNTNNFMKYLTVLEDLGNDLGVASVYNEELMKKAEKYQNKPDSLFELSSENYMAIFDKMIQNEKGSELGLILSGGWIETMYILFESAGEFNENPAKQDLILTQGLVLENLIGYLSEYNSNEDVKVVLEELAVFETIFQQVDCNEEETVVTKVDGAQVLSGGQSCSLSKDLYNTLKGKISDYRTKITQN